MTVKLLLMQIGCETDPDRCTLSALRNASTPNQIWLCCMELHSKILCPSLSTQARAVQLSKKASFRQDLSRLNLPYRLATRPELDALKAAHQLSIQAPSAMLMKLNDGVTLLNSRGYRRVRRTIVRQCGAWTKGTGKQQVVEFEDAAQPEVQAPLSGRGKRKSRDSEPRKPRRASDGSDSITIQPFGPETSTAAIEVATDSSEDSNDSEEEEMTDLSAAEILTTSEWFKMWRVSHADQVQPSPAKKQAVQVVAPVEPVVVVPQPEPAAPEATPFAVSTRSAFSKFKTRGRKSSEPFSYSYAYQFPTIHDSPSFTRTQSQPEQLMQRYPSPQYC